MRSLFVKAIFALSILILSCTNSKKAWRYNKQIILQVEDSPKTCDISIDSIVLIRDFSEFNFNGYKKKLNVICTDSSSIGKYLMQEQIDSELFYNGSCKLVEEVVHLISFRGHSGMAVGKTEGYLFFQNGARKRIVKIFSEQVEDGITKSFIKHGYMLTIRINSYRNDADSFNYVVSEINHRNLNILDEVEGAKIFKKKFYNVKMEYSQSVME
jgi:hypothetical protein